MTQALGGHGHEEAWRPELCPRTVALKGPWTSSIMAAYQQGKRHHENKLAQELNSFLCQKKAMEI